MLERSGAETLNTDRFKYCVSEDEIVGSAQERASMHDEWVRFIGRHVCTFKLSKTIPRETGFQVEARNRSGSGFGVARFKTIASKSRLMRGVAEIAADGRDQYIVYMPLRGALELGQLGREASCDPSTFVLLSASESLSHTKLGDNDTISYVMPRDFVDQRLVQGENLCVRAIGTREGLGHLARNTLTALQQSASAMNEREFQSASCLVGDLLLLALSGCDDVMAGQRSIRAANLARAKQIIRNRLDDPDLTLTEIATECRISLGYLHNLFRDDGLTVWQFLKAERLQRARRLLEFPPSRNTTVTDVSLASGFSNMSHFSTAFKRAFGLSPNDVLRGR